MAKKDPKKEKKAQLFKEDADVVARVEEMMEPEPKKVPAPADAADEPSTAPVVADLPVPDKPLEIKILRDNEPVEEPEVPTAPPLEAGAMVQPDPTPPAEEKTPQPGPTEAAPAEDKAAVSEDGQTPPATEPVKSELPASPVEDHKTAEAVEDIIRNDSDELLKAEDKKLAAAFKPPAQQTFTQKLRAALVDVWQNPMKRKVLIGSMMGLVLLIGAVPASRYFVLNSVGVRASASIRIIDESTMQPLKNVEVSLHGASVRTDDNGDARLQKIKLGATPLKIERRAFAPVERKVTIGWGSNPLGEEKLRPTGTQYAFRVSDYLSGKPVAKAEATSDDASAFSDEQGKILLTLEDPADEIEVTITSEGRRIEQFNMSGDTKDERKVHMVPARKHAYISRREGRFDIYAAYADAKDETLVLKGTGNERDDMALVPHPSESLIALVSTREGKRNEDGYLLSTLDIIDLSTNEVTSVQASERIQPVGWFGERLAYVRIVSGTSAGHPQRSRLMAYHYKDATNNELAAANYFNDVMAIEDRIYYAPSGAYQNGKDVKLLSVKADGSDRKDVLSKEVWNIFRTSYEHIALAVPNEWYDFGIKGERATKLSGEPANLTSRVYINSPNGKKSVWIDSRDGKGVLIVYDIESGEEKSLRTESGLKTPMHWLNDSTVVYRIKTETETADYVLSLDGGEPKKIADVTNTDGIDRWYYY